MKDSSPSFAMEAIRFCSTDGFEEYGFRRWDAKKPGNISDYYSGRIR
jgi:hypothetical protein